MRNVKALAAHERDTLATTLFESPELTAMTTICRLLTDLPEDARMRVMRWSFGRFSDEFKRPLPDPQSYQAPSRVLAWEEPAPRAGAPMPEQTPELDPTDFARQVSELTDLFTRPRGLSLGSSR